jgi:hypothetical protein
MHISLLRVADSHTEDDIVTACRMIAPPFLQFSSVKLKETVCRIFNLTAEWFAQSVTADCKTSALLLLLLLLLLPVA